MNEPSASAAQPSSHEQVADSSDEAIALRVRAGEVALYGVLMRRYNQRLYRAVRAILRDESEIEDILQEAYLAAYRNLAGFEGRARFSTWLIRIAVNKALDRRRQRSCVAAFSAAAAAESKGNGAATIPAHASEDPERRNARRELALLLEAAIDALPDLFRGVYVLRDVDGMSTEETAESLGLEPNTVKTRLHRARSLLRERLANDFEVAGLRAFPFGAQRCDRLVAAVLGRLASIEPDAR